MIGGGNATEHFSGDIEVGVVNYSDPFVDTLEESSNHVTLWFYKNPGLELRGERNTGCSSNGRFWAKLREELQ